MVDRLLSAGADANAALMNGETVLMTCARAGDAGAVKALLARGADVNAREREHRQTALMWAAAERHPEVVRAADRSPRRHSRPLPDLSADRRRRADTARGARGAELHGVARRRHAVAVCRPATETRRPRSCSLKAPGRPELIRSPDGVQRASVLAAHSGNGTRRPRCCWNTARSTDSAGGIAGAASGRPENAMSHLVKRTPRARRQSECSGLTKGTPMRRDTTIGICRRRSSDRRRTAGGQSSRGPRSCGARGRAGADPSLTMPNGATP
jgi:hypothetical protein